MGRGKSATGLAGSESLLGWDSSSESVDVHDPFVLISHWRTNHLITDALADTLRDDVQRHETSTPRPNRVVELVVEALGYLGGVLIVVALGLVVGRFWSGLPTWTHLTAALVVTALLLAAGFGVPAARSGSADRLRSVLWVVATVVFAGAGALVAYDVVGWRSEKVALTATTCAVALSAVLWFLHPRALQQVAFFVAVCATVGLSLSLIPEPPPVLWEQNLDGYVPPGTESLPGLGLWFVGAVWLLLSWARIVKPRILGFGLGAVGMVFGAVATTSQLWGLWLGVATVMFLIALAIYLRDFALLVIGAVGTLQVLPQLVTQLFPGVLAAAGVLLVVGLGLVGAAVLIARTRFGSHKATGRVRFDTLPLPALFVSVAVVTVGVATTVVVVTEMTLD